MPSSRSRARSSSRIRWSRWSSARGCGICRISSRPAAARSTPGTRRCGSSKSLSTTRPMLSAISIPPTSSDRPPMDDAMTAPPKTLREASCADDYDPNSMPVAKARELIRTFLSPVAAVERVPVRSALGRVLATDVTSPIAVPGHDNSAMDGYAVRFADLNPDGETLLKRVGESFAGKPWPGSIAAGECVRIFTGGVMPSGADSVVMQERTREDPRGVHIAAGALTKAGTNRRFAGEDLKAGQIVFRAGQRIHPAELGMVASLGLGELGVYRKLRVAFFSTGDELK